MSKIIIPSLFIIFSTFAFSQSGAKVGDKAPAITVEEWLKGESVNSFEEGKVYLVEFWATWCGPCVQNIPHLSAIQEKDSSKGLIVIGVATHELDGRSKLDDFMLRRGSEMKYRVAYDTDYSMEKDWDTGTSGKTDYYRLPVCFLVNKTGKIAFVGHPGDKTLEDVIDKTLNE